MQEYLVCLIPKYSAQNITSNLAIYFWNIADYVGILVILQAIFNRILIGIRGFSCSVLLINGAPVKQVESTKLLGLNIDEHLSWSVHVDAIPKKNASGLGALKRIWPFVSLSALHTIFYSLIQPDFDYCSVVWGNCN